MARSRPQPQAARELVFLVAGETYRLPAERVLEVIRTPAITRVPLAKGALAGVINFHGTAIPVVEVDRLLGGTSPAPAGAGSRVIVYRDGDVLGLLVDGLLQVEEARGRRQAGRSLDMTELLDRQWYGPERSRSTASALPVEPVGTAERSVEQGRALLGFLVAGQHYALPLEAVREVMALPSGISPLAGTGPAVLGLTNFRDMVVPLISLASLLGLDERMADGRRNVVVASIGSWVVGLVTGTIDRIIRLAESAVDPVPPVLQRGEGDAEIDAIGRLDGGQSLVSILSPGKLFGNQIIAAAFSTLEQKESSMQGRAEGTATEQFVVLDLGDERYGLPIAAVDEIVQLPDAITRLPKAPAFVAGVINLRGTPLPVIDQRRRFEAQPSSITGRRPRVVVVTVDGLRAGFIVDGVSEILSLSPELVRPAPGLPGDDTKVFDRVAPIGNDGEMLLLVDPKQLLDRAERDLLAVLKLADRPAAS